jgi:hypothetical protein
MERRLSIPVGVVAERTTIGSTWQSHAWRPAGVLIGDTALTAGSLLRDDGRITSYYAGNARLELHPTDVDSYRHNLEQAVPRIYVVLAETAEDAPPTVLLVTAAPDEASSYFDGDGRMVDGVPMGRELTGLIAAYVAGHARPTTPDKRRYREQPRPTDDATSFHVEERS